MQKKPNKKSASLVKAAKSPSNSKKNVTKITKKDSANGKIQPNAKAKVESKKPAAKPAVKSALKSVKKPLEKPAPKQALKPSPKPTAKSTAKPLAKAAAKSSAKSAPKLGTKAPAKKSESKKVESKKPIEKNSPLKKSPSKKPSANKTTANSASTKKVSSKKSPAKKLVKPSLPLPTQESQAAEMGLEELTFSILKPGKVKEKIWRTKSFAQLSTEAHYGFPEISPELPDGYHESKLVLMPKDPEYLFCYWELTPELLNEKEKAKDASAKYTETLKINWESKSLFEPNFTFIPVFFWARKWYFGVPQSGPSYQVELGWLSDTGHFISLLKSNSSALPELWTETQKRLEATGGVLAYSAKHTQTIGSSEQMIVEEHHSLRPNWNMNSESFSSSSWANKNSNGTLEVSGKVLHGVQVDISGQAAALDAGGNFSVQLPLSDELVVVTLKTGSGLSRSLAYNIKELVPQ